MPIAAAGAADGGRARMSTYTSPTELVAYVDESVCFQASGGIYIVAAAVIADARLREVRETLRLLLRPPFAPASATKLHYRDLTAASRRKAAGVVRDAHIDHLVAVGAPLNPRKQERARRHCLERLLMELDAWGAHRVYLESRLKTQNRLDARLIAAAHAKGYISRQLWMDHQLPSTEPLLWIPDIVAGAVGDAHLGSPDTFAILEEHVIEFKIKLR